MSALTILRYPAARLRRVARTVEAVDARIRTLIEDMLETMYAASGIGLAATQVDVHERVVVLDISETHDQPLALVNPEIVWESSEHVRGDEGCLSLPGIQESVERAARVTVAALGADGQLRRIEADGLLAVCLQHELDHLQGKVFVDALSSLKRTRIKTRLQKQEREAARDARQSAPAL
ncbi:MAG: peptide deformylase [Burkholderiaceae bacterium]|jgi:peptide deformylase|nr:peptide deformylase [Burkholderiaceae bacterium]